MQLLSNSSLYLLQRCPFFKRSGRTHPFRKHRDCGIEPSEAEVMYTVSWIPFIHRQLMWCPLTSNSNQPLFYLRKRKTLAAYVDAIFCWCSWQSREKKSEQPDDSHCPYLALNTLQKPSIIQVLFEMKMMRSSNVCVSMHLCMLWRGVSLPWDVKVIFWIQIEWMRWLLHKSRIVTSQ